MTAARIPQEQPCILLVDDAKLSQHVIAQMLAKSGYSNIAQLNQAQDVRAYLIKNHIDLIILDWMMPGIDGLALSRIIREIDKQKQSNTAIIMVTGKDSTAAMQEAFQSGVDDFVAKADVATQLLPRLQLALARSHAMSQLKTQQKHLRQVITQQKSLITQDPVSKLPTQQAARDYLNTLIKHSITRDVKCSALYFTIENLHDLQKQTKTYYLDHVIEALAAKIRKALRPQDFLARIDRNRFIAFIEHQQLEPIRSFDRFAKLIDGSSFYTPEGFKTIAVKVAASEIHADICPHQNPLSQLTEYLHEAIQQTSQHDCLQLDWPSFQANTDQLTEEEMIFDCV